jgi:hypothetical protein
MTPSTMLSMTEVSSGLFCVAFACDRASARDWRANMAMKRADIVNVRPALT